MIIFKIINRIIKQLKHLTKTLIGKALIIALCMIIAGTFAFYFLEIQYQNLTLLDTFYWTIITMTTIGYGDISPVSPGGKILSLFIAIFGVSIMAVSMGSIASFILELKFFKERRFVKMAQNMKDFILICGWNERIKIILEELKNEYTNIVIISEKERPEDWDSSIPYIHGDPSNDDILKKANVFNASKALIDLDDDGKSLLTVLSIESLNPECYTIAKINNHENAQHFKRVNCDKVICKNTILGKLLTISVHTPEVFTAYDELISIAGNEIYPLYKIEDYIGKDFKDLIILLKEKHNATLIGLIRDNKTLINPSLDEKIQKNDILLLISEKRIE